MRIQSVDCSLSLAANSKRTTIGHFYLFMYRECKSNHFLSVFLLFGAFECDTIRHFHVTDKFKDAKPIARSVCFVYNLDTDILYFQQFSTDLQKNRKESKNGLGFYKIISLPLLSRCMVSSALNRESILYKTKSDTTTLLSRQWLLCV